MNHLEKVFGKNHTPQSAPLPGRPDQTRNSADGYVWAVDQWTRLLRFLILGSEAGTYYITERALTIENANTALACLKADGIRVVNAVIEISGSGRAAKNDAALFVLAMASSPQFADGKTNSAALAALPLVARTASHLCAYAAYVESMRGWGRGLRSAIAHWYLNQPVHDLAYQMLKYQNRNGWAHRDLLRLAHPKAAGPAQNALFRWAVDGEIGDLPPGELKQVQGFELAKRATQEAEIVHLIEDYRLTHEMIPSEWKDAPAVWEALLDGMPYGATLRHLGKLTSIGLLAPQTEATALVVARLMDHSRVRRARIHPIAVLSALMVYRQGRGVRGNLRWAPVANVIDALDEAFYMAFENVEPTGRRIYLAVDASGSMTGSQCLGLPHVTTAMGSAAMAMSIARTEPNYTISGFHQQVLRLDITKKDRLDRAVAELRFDGGGTNAALPFEDALARRLEVDAFIVMTDNETWAGDSHPVQALAKYRRATGIPAKLVVVSMAANGFTITDPDDALQMDVAGFDASVPGVLAGFLREPA